jgi:aminoglycoside 6'-N-acetyltransferase I
LHVNTLEKIANIKNLNNSPYEFYLKFGYVIVGVDPDANGIGKPNFSMSKRIYRSEDLQGVNGNE